MKKYIFLYSLCFLWMSGSVMAQEDFRKNPPKGGPAPKIELGESTSFKLDNGLTVIVVENNRLPRLAFQLSVDAPPLVEGDKAGAASIAGQLLRSGTASKSKAEIDEAIDFIGASLNVSSVGMFGSSLTKHTDALLSLMQDILLNPSFPEAEFDKLKTQTISGLAFNKENPDAIAGRVANVVRYGISHPYGEFQSEETVNNIDLADCKQYYETYFKPNISYLVIVGDITVSKAKNLANTYFGSWEKGTVTKPKFSNPGLPAKTSVQIVNKPGAVQSVINVTYPIQHQVGSKDRMAAYVMNTILGGFSSGTRLNLNLREDKGYTYSANSTLSPDREIGSFTITTSVRNVVTDSAVIEIMNELNRLRDEKISEELLQETKNYVTGIFALQLESPQTVANYALNTIRYNLSADHYANYLSRLDKLTRDDIQAAAQKYLQPNKANIVIVGNQEEIAESLAKFGEVQVLDIYGKPVKAPSSAGDISAETVINNYLSALGGADKIKAVSDYTIEMEASIQGQTITMKQMKKAPGKMAMEVSMMGNVMQEVKFNGTAGNVTVMGQATKVEGKEAEAMKLEAALFPELLYGKPGYEVEIGGIESINGSDAYVVKLKDTGGSSKVDYFSVDSGLKIRSVSTASAQGQTVTTTNDYLDYKEVDGIQFPHTIKSSGAMPFPIEMKVKTISINGGLEDSTFEVK